MGSNSYRQILISRSSRSRYFCCERGQAAVELAIAVPLIMMFIVAVISLGQVGQKKALLARAAASAARVAIVRPDLAGEEAYAILKQSDKSIERSDVSTRITPAPIGKLPFTQTIKVDVTLNYRSIVGFGWRPTYKLRASFICDQYNNAIWFNIPRAN